MCHNKYHGMHEKPGDLKGLMDPEPGKFLPMEVLS